MAKQKQTLKTPSTPSLSKASGQAKRIAGTKFPIQPATGGKITGGSSSGSGTVKQQKNAKPAGGNATKIK